MDKQPNELSVSQAAFYLGYHRTYFYTIKDRIPYRRYRRRIYFKKSDLDEYLESEFIEHTPKVAS